MIAYAQKTIPDGDFRIADLERLPFANDTFDAVIAADSVQLAKDSVAALKELARVCKPAGRIAIATWDSPEKSDQSKVSRLLQDLAGGGGPNIFAVAAPGVMEEMLGRAGLTVTGGKSVPVPFRFRSFADYWSSTRTTATTKVAIAKSGEDTVRAALADLCGPLTESDNAVVFKNTFRYVLAAR